MPTLPFEIITLILLMLPTKTLVKFQCVCRAWRDLIRDRNFIQNHLQNRASTGKGYLLSVPIAHIPNRAFRLLCCETLEHRLNIKIPFESTSIRFMMIGSCNGLVCLSDRERFGSIIYLCNPYIRKYRIINFPITNIGISLHFDLGNVALGFGHHYPTNDYKVIRIVSPSEEINPEDISYVDEGWKIEVYSLNTNSWKNIEVDRYPWKALDMDSDKVVNGYVHWKATRKDKNEDVVVILAFHLGNEEFQDISLPNYNYEVDEDEFYHYIGIYKEMLSLFMFHQVEQGHALNHCYLWVMKKYGVVDSWTKMYSVMLVHETIQYIHITKNDEIVLENKELEMRVYNFENMTAKHLEVEKGEDFLKFANYIDSLVLLDEENEP